MQDQGLNRRAFLGTTGTGAALTALGTMAYSGTAEAQEKAGTDSAGKFAFQRVTGMKVGMLTNPFGGEPLERVLDFAKDAGIQCLECNAWPGSKHVDPTKIDAAEADRIKQMVAARGLEISGLAYYEDIADSKKGPGVQRHALKLVEAAALLGVPTVCMCAGWPVDGMSKIDTIRKVLPGRFAPVLALAKSKGVRIAIENYFATNLQGLDTFEVLFDTIKDDNFGLNYDPSHLYHQECDHLLPVSMFPKRIFHTHAKDTLVDRAKRAKVGILADDWWQYVIPGLGNIQWGEYVSHLRKNGYNGVMSIEHEDGSLNREQGFILAARFLRQFC